MSLSTATISIAANQLLKTSSPTSARSRAFTRSQRSCSGRLMHRPSMGADGGAPPASRPGTARDGWCAKAGNCDICVSGHHLRPTLNARQRRARITQPVTRRASAARRCVASAGLNCRRHQSLAKSEGIARARVARHDAPQIARNADPALALVMMVAPCLESPQPPYAMTVTYSCLLSRPCLALPGRRTHPQNRRPNLPPHEISARPLSPSQASSI